MGDDRIVITKLAMDGSNWVTYRDRMIWAFNSRQWDSHLTTTTIPTTYTAAGVVNGLDPNQRWNAEEAVAKNMMATSIPDHVFNRIKSKTSTMEVWNAIKALYQTRSKMITVDLGKKLQNTKLGDKDNAQAHFTQLMNLREQLASMGKTLNDDEFASILLGSLPPSYSPTIGGINAAADSTGNAITSNQVI